MSDMSDMYLLIITLINKWHHWEWKWKTAVKSTCAQDPKDEGDKLLDFAKEETGNDKKISGEAEEEEEEEEAGKMKWKDSLKIRRGKLKKLSLDGSTDEGQQSWQGDEVDNRQEFQVEVNPRPRVFFKCKYGTVSKNVGPVGLVRNLRFFALTQSITRLNCLDKKFWKGPWGSLPGTLWTLLASWLRDHHKGDPRQ